MILVQVLGRYMIIGYLDPESSRGGVSLMGIGRE